MQLEKLGRAIYSAVKKMMGSPILTDSVLRELLRDVQRALLTADVNVELVLKLTKNIEKRLAEEKLPPGLSKKEFLVSTLYDELSKLMGGEGEITHKLPEKGSVYLFVGIQGSGKTTSVAKLAKFYKKRGLKVAVVCADDFRPGAYAQLSQLLQAEGIPVYWEEGKLAVDLAISGLKKFREDGYDLILIDTAGRHKEEKKLLEDMKKIAEAVNPTKTILVIDGGMGQQAYSHAKAFNEAVSVGSIFVTKLDSSAKGGGALSAVSATGAPIEFIGVGEKIDDIEQFDSHRFVGRLIGIGDVKKIVEKAKELREEVSEDALKAISGGKLTLTDFFEMLKGMRKMGAFSKLLRLLPGLSYELPEELIELAEEKMQKWYYIIQSMTKEERENPKILNASRIARIARGSGTSEKDVKELIQRYYMLRKMTKKIKRLGFMLRRKRLFINQTVI